MLSPSRTGVRVPFSTDCRHIFPSDCFTKLFITTPHCLRIIDVDVAQLRHSQRFVLERNEGHRSRSMSGLFSGTFFSSTPGRDGGASGLESTLMTPAIGDPIAPEAFTIRTSISLRCMTNHTALFSLKEHGDTIPCEDIGGTSPAKNIVTFSFDGVGEGDKEETLDNTLTSFSPTDLSIIDAVHLGGAIALGVVYNKSASICWPCSPEQLRTVAQTDYDHDQSSFAEPKSTHALSSRVLDLLYSKEMHVKALNDEEFRFSSILSIPKAVDTNYRLRYVYIDSLSMTILRSFDGGLAPPLSPSGHPAFVTSDRPTTPPFPSETPRPHGHSGSIHSFSERRAQMPGMHPLFDYLYGSFARSDSNTTAGSHESLPVPPPSFVAESTIPGKKGEVVHYTYIPWTCFVPLRPSSDSTLATITSPGMHLVTFLMFSTPNTGATRKASAIPNYSSKTNVTDSSGVEDVEADYDLVFDEGGLDSFLEPSETCDESASTFIDWTNSSVQQVAFYFTSTGLLYLTNPTISSPPDAALLAAYEGHTSHSPNVTSLTMKVDRMTANMHSCANLMFQVLNLNFPQDSLRSTPVEQYVFNSLVHYRNSPISELSLCLLALSPQYTLPYYSAAPVSQPKLPPANGIVTMQNQPHLFLINSEVVNVISTTEFGPTGFQDSHFQVLKIPGTVQVTMCSEEAYIRRKVFSNVLLWNSLLFSEAFEEAEFDDFIPSPETLVVRKDQTPTNIHKEDRGGTDSAQSKRKSIRMAIEDTLFGPKNTPPSRAPIHSRETSFLLNKPIERAHSFFGKLQVDRPSYESSIASAPSELNQLTVSSNPDATYAFAVDLVTAYELRLCRIVLARPETAYVVSRNGIVGTRMFPVLTLTANLMSNKHFSTARAVIQTFHTIKRTLTFDRRKIQQEAQENEHAFRLMNDKNLPLALPLLFPGGGVTHSSSQQDDGGELDYHEGFETIKDSDALQTIFPPVPSMSEFTDKQEYLSALSEYVVSLSRLFNAPRQVTFDMELEQEEDERLTLRDWQVLGGLSDRRIRDLPLRIGYSLLSSGMFSHAFEVLNYTSISPYLVVTLFPSLFPTSIILETIPSKHFRRYVQQLHSLSSHSDAVQMFLQSVKLNNEKFSSHSFSRSTHSRIQLALKIPSMEEDKLRPKAISARILPEVVPGFTRYLYSVRNKLLRSQLPMYTTTFWYESWSLHDLQVFFELCHQMGISPFTDTTIETRSAINLLQDNPVSTIATLDTITSLSLQLEAIPDPILVDLVLFRTLLWGYTYHRDISDALETECKEVDTFSTHANDTLKYLQLIESFLVTHNSIPLFHLLDFLEATDISIPHKSSLVLLSKGFGFYVTALSFEHCTKILTSLLQQAPSYGDSNNIDIKERDSAYEAAKNDLLEFIALCLRLGNASLTSIELEYAQFPSQFLPLPLAQRVNIALQNVILHETTPVAASFLMPFLTGSYGSFAFSVVSQGLSSIPNLSPAFSTAIQTAQASHAWIANTSATSFCTLFPFSFSATLSPRKAEPTPVVQDLSICDILFAMSSMYTQDHLEIVRNECFETQFCNVSHEVRLRTPFFPLSSSSFLSTDWISIHSDEIGLFEVYHNLSFFGHIHVLELALHPIIQFDAQLWTNLFRAPNEFSNTHLHSQSASSDCNGCGLREEAVSLDLDPWRSPTVASYSSSSIQPSVDCHIVLPIASTTGTQLVRMYLHFLQRSTSFVQAVVTADASFVENSGVLKLCAELVRNIALRLHCLLRCKAIPLNYDILQSSLLSLDHELQRLTPASQPQFYSLIKKCLNVTKILLHWRRGEHDQVFRNYIQDNALEKVREYITVVASYHPYITVTWGDSEREDTQLALGQSSGSIDSPSFVTSNVLHSLHMSLLQIGIEFYRMEEAALKQQQADEVRDTIDPASKSLVELNTPGHPTALITTDVSKSHVTDNLHDANAATTIHKPRSRLLKRKAPQSTNSHYMTIKKPSVLSSTSEILSVTNTSGGAESQAQDATVSIVATLTQNKALPPKKTSLPPSITRGTELLQFILSIVLNPIYQCLSLTKVVALLPSSVPLSSLITSISDSLYHSAGQRKTQEMVYSLDRVNLAARQIELVNLEKSYITLRAETQCSICNKVILDSHRKWLPFARLPTGDIAHASCISSPST